MNSQDKVRFEIAVSVAVFASIAIMALETFSFPTDVQAALLFADAALSLIFVAEYIYRVATAENKRAYVTSFYGIIDLVAIFPILVHAVSSVRVVRLLRVLRIIRLLKIKRYSDAIDRYRQALKLIVAEATLFTGVAFVFIIGFAFLIYEFEHEAQPHIYSNIFDAIWCAVISLTSVGYGDVYPITPAGRLMTLAMVLTGMGIVAVPTALLASALSRVHNRESEAG
ncbi:MAG: potassium channel family protein [Chloroflexi bacterium]|nr:potassium channel family protein [Chloroflexota bacterium]